MGELTFLKSPTLASFFKDICFEIKCETFNLKEQAFLFMVIKQERESCWKMGSDFLLLDTAPLICASDQKVKKKKWECRTILRTKTPRNDANILSFFSQGTGF